MASSKNANPGLNYYQQSPVRGQLENPDGSARSGWRYIQCTDTPNELRVLIPPRTAANYNNLLKAEVAELAKGRTPNWERIVQIRHLKDRMIRKCTRLSRATTPKDNPPARVMFLTVHAPPDFRLKEMERWLRLQGGDSTKVTVEPATTPYCKDCPECMAHQARTQAHTQGQPTVRRMPSASRFTPPRGPTPERMTRRAAPPQGRPANFYLQSAAPPVRQDQRIRGHARQQSTSAAPGQHHTTVQGRRSGELLRAEHIARPHARSPDPIPIPYRAPAPFATHDADSYDDSSEGDSPVVRVFDLPISGSPVPAASPSPRESPSMTPPKVSSPPNGLPTIHEGSEDFEHEHRPIMRRRSSLKKRDSFSRLSVGSQSKSVAWAMDRDWVEQMSKYIKTSNEAEVLSSELDKLRLEYRDEIEAMRAVCLQLEASQDRVRIETAHLRQDESAVKDQENKILESSEQIALKQAEFQAKVLAVLEESKRVVQLCDKKRDIHDSS